MKLSQNEEKLIQMYRYLHPESKEKLMATAEILVNLGKSNTILKKKEKSGEWRIVKNLLSQRRRTTHGKTKYHMAAVCCVQW